MDRRRLPIWLAEGGRSRFGPFGFSFLRSGCQPAELFYTLAGLAIHCNHSKRTQCQYQTAVLDRLARNRYNRLRCSPTVEMTGAIRNTASSAFYGPCQSQFRIRVSLTLPNDVTKWLRFPHLCGETASRSWDESSPGEIYLFRLSSISISSLHFVKRANDGLWLWRTMNFDRTNEFFELLFFSDIFLAIKIYIWFVEFAVLKKMGVFEKFLPSNK